MDLAAAVLGTAPSPDQPLMEAGLDSLGAVDLRNSVSSAFGVELPPTATLDYPTIDALAKYIVSSMAPSTSTALVDPGYWSDELDVYGEAELAPTHITGLSCIYPGKWVHHWQDLELMHLNNLGDVGPSADIEWHGFAQSEIV